MPSSSKLGTDLIAYDVSDQLAITDVFLLVTAADERQVGAVVDGIEEDLRGLDAKPIRREGDRERRWVLLDYLDVVVHVEHSDEAVSTRSSGSGATVRRSRCTWTRADAAARIIIWRHGGPSGTGPTDSGPGRHRARSARGGLTRNAAPMLASRAFALYSTICRGVATPRPRSADLTGLEIVTDKRLREINRRLLGGTDRPRSARGRSERSAGCAPGRTSPFADGGEPLGGGQRMAEALEESRVGRKRLDHRDRHHGLAPAGWASAGWWDCRSTTAT